MLVAAHIAHASTHTLPETSRQTYTQCGRCGEAKPLPAGGGPCAAKCGGWSTAAGTGAAAVAGTASHNCPQKPSVRERSCPCRHTFGTALTCTTVHWGTRAHLPAPPPPSLNWQNSTGQERDVPMHDTATPIALTIVQERPVTTNKIALQMCFARVSSAQAPLRVVRHVRIADSRFILPTVPPSPASRQPRNGIKCEKHRQHFAGLCALHHSCPTYTTLTCNIFAKGSVPIGAQQQRPNMA